LSRIEEDGRKWMRRPILCTKKKEKKKIIIIYAFDGYLF